MEHPSPEERLQAEYVLGKMIEIRDWLEAVLSDIGHGEDAHPEDELELSLKLDVVKSRIQRCENILDA